MRTFQLVFGLIILVLTDLGIGFFLPAREYQIALAPLTTTFYEGAHFRFKCKTNRFGFRGQEITPDRRKDTLRGVVIGNSYTFGWGVNLQDTWVNRIEEELQAQGLQQEGATGLEL